MPRLLRCRIVIEIVSHHGSDVVRMMLLELSHAGLRFTFRLNPG
jgi:hypothetical protein